MVHRFATFEIDAGTRELRFGGGSITPQPRVFDLLLYLATNRERVVSKDELLERVWPGVIVTDGSLQRAVSLARTALAKVGAPNAIRTFARQGYRLFDGAFSDETAGKSAAVSVALEAARNAYAAGDWDRASAEFAKVGNPAELNAEDLQAWAHAAQCAGRPDTAAEPLERVVAACVRRGNRRLAAWGAFLIGQLRFEWCESALARGWHQRALRWLGDEPAVRERGYIDMLSARMALHDLDAKRAHEFGERARAAGEACGDADLEILGLVHSGLARIYEGKICRGLDALDEAGAAVVSSGLSAWAGGMVYCKVIFAYMTQADWQRAGQWTSQFTRWCEGRGVEGSPALCRLHRAEVLNVRGQLAVAEREIRATIATVTRQAPWVLGDAWGVLGDVLLAKGDYDGARNAYRRAIEQGFEGHLGLALVHFSEGNAAAAAKLLGGLVRDNRQSVRPIRGQVLAYQAIFTAMLGRVDESRAMLEALESEAAGEISPAVRALSERARGEIAAAEGRRSEAIRRLRTALEMWLKMETPVPAARLRYRLAELLEQEGESEAAELERTAAVAALRQTGAKLGQVRTRVAARATATAGRGARRR